MAKQGWISLHRSIQDNWIWNDEPFDKAHAWVDILLMANHKDNKFLLGSELIKIDAGSFITSEKKLSERWEWGRTKVRNFLKLLESDEMILKITDTKKTTIKVINYKQYQRFEGHEENTKNQPTNNERTTDKQRTNNGQTTSVQRANTNNNVNNANHVNNDNTVNKKQVVGSPELHQIIDYLNKALDANFRTSTKATQDVIKARLKEKYTIDDFKQVIDIKNAEWSGDSKTAVWLRPSTLFGNKFESYLNQKPKSAMSDLPQNLQNAFALAEAEKNKPQEMNIFEQIRSEQDSNNDSGGIPEF